MDTRGLLIHKGNLLFCEELAENLVFSIKNILCADALEDVRNLLSLGAQLFQQPCVGRERLLQLLPELPVLGSGLLLLFQQSLVLRLAVFQFLLGFPESFPIVRALSL